MQTDKRISPPPPPYDSVIERVSRPTLLVFIHVIIPLATPGDYRLNNIQPNTSADCVKRRPLVDSSFIHSALRPLLWVANVPCKRLVSAALFIWSYHFEPVQYLRSSTHVRLGLPLPRLHSCLHSIVLSRVGETVASCYRGRLSQGRFMQNYNTDG